MESIATTDVRHSTSDELPAVNGRLAVCLEAGGRRKQEKMYLIGAPQGSAGDEGCAKEMISGQVSN